MVAQISGQVSDTGQRIGQFSMLSGMAIIGYHLLAKSGPKATTMK